MDLNGVQNKENNERSLVANFDEESPKSKQLEAALGQLQEQLQLNLMQQSYLLHVNTKDASEAFIAAQKVKELELGQFQIMLHIQLIQQQFSRKINVTNSTNLDSNSMLFKVSDNENEQTNLNSCYECVWCKWTGGCQNTKYSDLTSFLKHITTEHLMDDKDGAQQARIQMQVINQLEMQLQKEKERLCTMMEQLANNSTKKWLPQESISMNNSINLKDTFSLSNRMNLDSLSSSQTYPNQLSVTKDDEPSKRLLDAENDYNQTKEFYKINDVRPPFTYASLIRQAIMDSKEKQLSLNEIYNWFQNTFAYFRRNAATWKNAIRTNLSLHKCFVRYEDEFGSFWTVDDAEFLKRRHLTRGRPRKYSGNIIDSEII